MVEPVERNEGYDDWLDAIEAGEAFYLECPNGRGSLPPRRVCTHCGEPELTEQPLAASGTLETHTVVHVATPQLEDDTPYVTAIADFGPVRLTGMLRGRDPDSVEQPLEVAPSVETTETTGDRVLVFRPR
jgi:uncharacterized OB-fold protein